MSRTDGSKRKCSVSTEKKTKKRKNDRQNLQKRWEESIPKRKGFRCERQIEESSLEGTNLAQIIKSRGLTHFFKLVKGYVVEWVMEFYKSMQIVEGETQRIKSKVGGKELTIAPDDIAMYLEYQRPHWSQIGYPGGLKDNYRTMNKLLYCNLLPRGKEKVPQDEQNGAQNAKEFSFLGNDYSLLFGNWVEAIYYVQVQETNDQSSVIKSASKGITQSRKQTNDPTEPPSTSAPKQKGSQSKMMKILKSILCRQVEIQEDQKRINKKEELHHLTICKIAEKLGVEIDALDEGKSDGQAIGEHISPESSDGGVSLSEEDSDPGDV
ncbi:hypothetical protein Vadar_027248 [Vaccinium darrowii]|uniref:Uncharacterized protein n=1 Tax=Vaccinium darrowii TaxID=229202 RepID=A0ACB7XCT9_9ERIC|nr:hypothetical protein Vadar_027248 [Vaccinium darrowii]